MSKKFSMSIVAGVLLLLVGVVGLIKIPLSASASQPYIVKKHLYVALGDSLAAGFQPNKDTSHGYFQALSSLLQDQGITDSVNFGCTGETSTTMIQGNCPSAQEGSDPQLTTALRYLKEHAAEIGLVTIDIGANDVLRDIDPRTCKVNEDAFSQDLAYVDNNLTNTILPQIRDALTLQGHLTTRIVLLNYYDPYQNLCPATHVHNQTLNLHLSNDISGYGTIIDVSNAFGGGTTPNNQLCDLTWICSNYKDIHPTSAGYELIAKTAYNTLYPTQVPGLVPHS